jgi:hypothetical protein
MASISNLHLCLVLWLRVSYSRSTMRNQKQTLHLPDPKKKNRTRHPVLRKLSNEPPINPETPIQHIRNLHGPKLHRSAAADITQSNAFVKKRRLLRSRSKDNKSSRHKRSMCHTQKIHNCPSVRTTLLKEPSKEETPTKETSMIPRSPLRMSK